MERDLLISYAVYCKGEYRDMISAINENRSVPLVRIDNAVTIFDEAYPSRLFDLKYPPMVLFYKGDITLLNRKAIGVVGS